MNHPPPPPWPGQAFQIRLRETADGGVELHHDAGYTLTVNLEPPEYPGRVDHPAVPQAVATAVWTTLRFPPPEHDWVEITSLGEWEREWTCSACPARLFERRKPDAPR